MFVQGVSKSLIKFQEWTPDITTKNKGHINIVLCPEMSGILSLFQTLNI